MAISNPDHWIEEGFFKGPKYDKIVAMIAAINARTTAPAAHKTSHEDGGSDEIDLTGLQGAFVAARNSVPLYEHTRIGNFSWISTDEYLSNILKARASTYYTYIYPVVRETLTTVEVRVYGTYTANVPGASAWMKCTVNLQYLDDGGTWTTLATNSFQWDDSDTSTECITLSSITPATACNRQFRIQIAKTQADPAADPPTATMYIYACNLTQ